MDTIEVGKCRREQLFGIVFSNIAVVKKDSLSSISWWIVLREEEEVTFWSTAMNNDYIGQEGVGSRLKFTSSPYTQNVRHR